MFGLWPLPSTYYSLSSLSLSLSSSSSSPFALAAAASSSVNGGSYGRKPLYSCWGTLSSLSLSLNYQYLFFTLLLLDSGFSLRGYVRIFLSNEFYINSVSSIWIGKKNRTLIWSACNFDSLVWESVCFICILLNYSGKDYRLLTLESYTC